MTDFIRLIVSPEAMGAKGRQFAIVVEDGPVLGRSRLPFTAGARLLIEAGYPAEALMTMRHAGSTHDSFKPMPVGIVAGFTVSEADGESARFRRFKEYQIGGTVAEISPISPSDDMGQPETEIAVYGASCDAGEAA